jgi:hypothetical protein
MKALAQGLGQGLDFGLADVPEADAVLARLFER